MDAPVTEPTGCRQEKSVAHLVWCAGRVRNQTERLKPPHPYSLCEHTDRMTILHSFLCRRKSMSLPYPGKRFTMGCSFTWRLQR